MGATVAQCVIRLGAMPLDDAAMSGGRSRLGWLMRELMRFGVSEFLLLGDAIPDGPRASLPASVRIDLVAPPAGAGSGGALYGVREQLQERFLLCGSELLVDWNFANLLRDAAGDPAEVVGRMVRFGGGAGDFIGVFRNAVAGYLQPVCGLVDDVLPDLAQRGLLRSTDVAAGAVEAGFWRGAVFLDRDGVLNVDRGYVGSLDRFTWVDGALDAIRYATEAGWHVFVVTNQSGVARGLYSEAAVRSLLAWMADAARAAGGTIDDSRFCPFHPEAAVAAYRRMHPWRKPLPGMLLDVISAWELSAERAVMIGDQETDMAAARAAGVAGFLFPGGNLLAFLRPILEARGGPAVP